MDPRTTRKLRALVYTGLAGGLVGVSTYSAAGHGNAYSTDVLPDQVTWQADDIVIAGEPDGGLRTPPGDGPQ